MNTTGEVLSLADDFSLSADLHSGTMRMLDVGLYIVTLNNEEPISVNAHDPRIAHRCIHVSRLNCKLGKARSLAQRRLNYIRTFGAENANFRPIAVTDDIGRAERLVLVALRAWRIRGKTGRSNEWLEGIEPAEAERVALSALDDAGIEFKLPRR
jgi:hypothetical protein